MKIFQLGSIAISLKWLVLGVAILTGLLVLKIWLQRSQPKHINKKIFELVTNSLFWGFIFWKGSLILLDPKLVWKSPLSLLYFTGGSKGFIVAILLTGIYFIYKIKKIDVPKIMALKTVLIFSIVVMGMYYVVSGLFLQTDSALTSSSKQERSTNLHTGIQEGEKAPDFQLDTLEGEAIKLSDSKGKKVVLNFWATWCPPCKAEMPHVERFYQDQENNRVEILAVNLTTSEKGKNEISQFIKDYELTFPILLDENGDIADMYQAITIPTSYIIDSNGIIRKKIVGPIDQEMLEEIVASIE
ncbi:peroxiredoxin family protein [Neobacillus sp. LXY-4]|uniref:peroxiredoxin family protein n=1 Tax=Neobacillus sp. LXY-4 TaxID=3379826 RepID=UPI003EE30E02